VLRMRHVRLVILYGLHWVVENLAAVLWLGMGLMVMMAVDIHRNSSVRRRRTKSGYCRSLGRYGSVVSTNAA